LCIRFGDDNAKPLTDGLSPLTRCEPAANEVGRLSMRPDGVGSVAMALRRLSPMLARSGAIPTGDYAFEVKWDGFRALVSRNGDFQVRSRRGWNMTALLPELGDLPSETTFDGESSRSLTDGRTSHSSATGSCTATAPSR
jgi:ATP-dependent DNA ligase